MVSPLGWASRELKRKDDRPPKDQLYVIRTDQEANKMGIKGMAGPVM